MDRKGDSVIFSPCTSIFGNAAVIDIETTGLNPDFDDILQVAVVEARTRAVVCNYFYGSDRDSWPEAQAVNGISPEMVRDYPKASEFPDEISKALEGFDAIIGYNIGFDLKFLRRAGVKIPKVPVVDLMLDFSEFRQEYVLKRHKLSEACAWAGVSLFKAHDAVYDAQATAALFVRLQEEILNG